MSWIVSLSALPKGATPNHSTVLRLVGGKAAGLRTLVDAGLPTPSTLILTSEAYSAFLSKFSGDIDALYRSFSPGRPPAPSEDQLRLACGTVQAKIKASLNDADPAQFALRQSLTEASSSFEGQRLAVRSSATVEDGEQSAFAGVFHSELDVTAEPDALEAAVLNCWARAFDYAVITHVLAQGLDPRAVTVPLLIQEFIQAERSGVIFTQDPSGATPSEAWVSIVEGSGAELMQGERSGRHLRFDRTKGCPEEPLIDSIHRRALELEKSEGRPQDVEWVIQDGKCIFVQSRAITTIEERRQIIWTRELSAERFPKPLSPLGWSVLQSVLGVNLETLARFGLKAKRPDDVARLIGHYVYSNKTFFKIPGSLRFNPLSQARRVPAILWAMIRIAVGLPRAVLSTSGRLLKQWIYGELFRGFLQAEAESVLGSWDQNLESHLGRIDSFESVDPSTLAGDEIWRHGEAMDLAAREYMRPDLAIYAVKMACSWLVQGLCPPGQDWLPRLTAGLADNRTLRMNDEFSRITFVLRADPVVSRLLDENRLDEIVPRLGDFPEVKQFIHDNGHLTTNWDLRVPTWGEDPILLLQLVRATRHADADFRSNREAHQSLRETSIAQAESAMPRWLRPQFRLLLKMLHDFMRIDEEHHFYCARLFQSMRRFYSELGSRLFENGVLESPGDVYFLTRPEIRDAFSSTTTQRYRVKSRRASFERAESTAPPLEFHDQTPMDRETRISAGGTLMVGQPASPGKVTGIVRRVESSADLAQVRSGDIIVAISPKPEWTPVFAMAGGLITTSGDVLSHGFVSAREYRLPAVTEVAGAMENLRDGQKVVLDGDRGTVRLVETTQRPVTTLLFDLDGTLVDMDRAKLELRFLLRASARFAPAIRPWKFKSAFWAAARAMQANQSDVPNYQVFINALSNHSRLSSERLDGITRRFIDEDFSRLGAVFSPVRGARESLEYARDLGYKILLATNPVWPLKGVELRLQWAGLADFPFEYITHAEIMTRCKPGADYYTELCRRASLDPRDCLMIGNDPVKDLPAREAGIRTFILETEAHEAPVGDSRLDGYGTYEDLREWLAILKAPKPAQAPRELRTEEV